MSPSRLRLPRGPAAIAAGLLAVLPLGVLLSERGDERAEQKAVRHSPAASVARLDARDVTTLHLRDAAAIVDFDADRDRAVFLDPQNAQVIVLNRGANGWEPAFTFGRHGAGPGELQAPSGIAIARNGDIVVADEARLHWFSGTGEYVRSIPLRVNCRLMHASVAAAARGLFVAGSCHRPGPTTDSLVAVLFWTGDEENFTQVASDLRYTRDDVGLPLGSTAPLNDGAPHHLFGVGRSNCIYEISELSAVPAADRVCGLVAERYKAPPDAETEAFLRQERARRPEMRNLMRWPDELPVYVSSLVVHGQNVLLRPFTDDSIVFETMPERREVLVMPESGLATCRRYGCLWSRSDEEGVTVKLVTIEKLDEIMMRGKAAR